MRGRAERLLACGLLALGVGGCGGDERGPDPLALYHLESALGPPGDAGELRCGPPRACPGVVAQPAPHAVRYEVLEPPGVEGDAILPATARAVGSTVTVSLTAEGTGAFARLTREVARYGERDQGWHHVAVVVGDEIVGFPEVDFDAYPDGIRGAQSLSIRALHPADAKALASRLRGS